jgi:hypothetical protein
VDSAWKQDAKRLEARKMLLNRAESPASDTRFVGRRFVVRDSLTMKDLPTKNLTKLLHETLTLATT